MSKPFKMRGPSLYRKTPLEYEKDPKEFAKRKSGPKNEKSEGIVYRNGKTYYKAKDGSLHTGQVSDYEQEKAEDEAGVGSGSNRKVMKDGFVNETQKEKIRKERERYNALTEEEKKAEQKAANEKRKKFEQSEEYKKRRKAINNK